MASPPASPKGYIPAHGLSCSSGGTMRGRAYGNHPNIADNINAAMDPGLLLDNKQGPGRIHLYVSHDNPANVSASAIKPTFSVNVHDIQNCATIQAVVEQAAKDYSPIRGMNIY